MAALWIAAAIARATTLPSAETMRQAIIDQLAFMDTATDGHHCEGTKIIPFSRHNVDEVLDDLGVNISAVVRATHWLNPINPAAYRRVTPALLRKLPTGTAAAAAQQAGGSPDPAAPPPGHRVNQAADSGRSRWARRRPIRRTYAGRVPRGLPVAPARPPAERGAGTSCCDGAGSGPW